MCCIFINFLINKKNVDLENAFRAADKDKSGQITLDEWMNVLRSSGQDVTRYVIIKARKKIVGI